PLVPVAFVPLSALPLTSQGKVDRSALPVPASIARAPRDREHVPPRTQVEREIASAWSAALNISDLAVDDNFFALGGHSLMATRVVARIRESLHVFLSVREFFESPTIAGLARRVEASLSSKRPQLPPLRVRRASGPIPASHAQRRLGFVDRLRGESCDYHIVRAWKVVGALDCDLLHAAIAGIVQRHEILRTRFEEVNGEPIQIIEPEMATALVREDVRQLDASAREARIEAAIRNEWERPFDLARGPLLRARVLRTGDHEHVLVRTMHHIVSDGWSEA